MSSIDIREAKMLLSRLVEDAAAGKEIVITRAGRPVARLVPITRTKRARTIGALKGKLVIPDDFDAPLTADDHCPRTSQ